MVVDLFLFFQLLTGEVCKCAAPERVPRESYAEVLCKSRENMMELNLALGRLQGPHHCTLIIIHTDGHTPTVVQAITLLLTVA